VLGTLWDIGPTTPRSGSTQVDTEPADAETAIDEDAVDKSASAQENAAIQEAISSLNAVQTQHQRAQTGTSQPGKGPVSSACFHHMIGKYNMGAACTFSHGKGDATELLKILNANFARNYGSDTTISSIVKGITNADVIHIRLRVNGTSARTLIDTGAVSSFVAKQFVHDARLPVIRADTPLGVDLAGTGVIRQLTAYAVLQVDATSPMTKVRTSFEVRLRTGHGQRRRHTRRKRYRKSSDPPNDGAADAHWEDVAAAALKRKLSATS